MEHSLRCHITFGIDRLEHKMVRHHQDPKRQSKSQGDTSKTYSYLSGGSVLTVSASLLLGLLFCLCRSLCRCVVCVVTCKREWLWEKWELWGRRLTFIIWTLNNTGRERVPWFDSCES